MKADDLLVSVNSADNSSLSEAIPAQEVGEEPADRWLMYITFYYYSLVLVWLGSVSSSLCRHGGVMCPSSVVLTKMAPQR
jgi:hypothetical protein